jgi:hypothetical protein
MKRHTWKLAVLVAASMFAIGSWAQTQSGNEWHWSGKLASDQLLQIKNVNGAIEADGVPGDTIEVVAYKSGEDKDQVRIEMVNGPEGVTICTVYPGAGNSCEAGSDYHQRTRDLHAKVDFAVKIPRNLRFDAATVNGKVRAEGMGRVVKANSVNGGVTVATDAWAQASSVNGSVSVRMGRADWPGTLHLSSVNGSVELDVPATLSADVAFSSVNGSLDSDLPLTISHSSGRWGPKSVEGRIGSGGRELKVNTVNGSLRIRTERAGI